LAILKQLQPNRNMSEYEDYEYVVLYPINTPYERSKLKKVHEMRMLAVQNNYPIQRDRLSTDTYLYTIPDLKFQYKEDYA
jgi:hypothetical protein